MILIIKTSKEKIHDLEFVNPVKDILDNRKTEVIHYKSLRKTDLKNAKKIIITGTSLKDNEFLKDLKKFNWIKKTDIPILGICAGFQIIGLTFNQTLKRKIEIGYTKEVLKEKFLGKKGEIKVYNLHNNTLSIKSNFNIYNKGKIPLAIKHKEKEIYGALFHPEVRNKDIIINFIENE